MVNARPCQTLSRRREPPGQVPPAAAAVAPRVRRAAAEVEPRNRRLVPCEAGHGSQEERLIEAHLATVEVPSGEPEAGLEILGPRDRVMEHEPFPVLAVVAVHDWLPFRVSVIVWPPIGLPVTPLVRVPVTTVLWP